MGSDGHKPFGILETGRFNPRSHMGSDVSRLVLVNPDAEVSIHAPTWGATDMQDDIDRFNEVSIHAPTWGATELGTYNAFNQVFQSTLPHGERPPAAPYYRMLRAFQSTLPHGERPYILYISLLQ